MYLAGALHDIGKMAVGNEILEKPDKLTDEEFDKMKNHAGYTYLMLSQVDGFEDIRDWAALHHEKLNGKGYPFGKTADENNLSFYVKYLHPQNLFLPFHQVYHMFFHATFLSYMDVLP